MANGAAAALAPGSEDGLEDGQTDDDEPDLTTRDRIFVAAKVEMRRRAEEWIAKVRERGGLAGPQSGQRPVLSNRLAAEGKERAEAPPARRKSSRPARVQSVTRLKVPTEQLLADDEAPPSKELADLRAELADLGAEPAAAPPPAPSSPGSAPAVELPVPSAPDPPVAAAPSATDGAEELGGAFELSAPSSAVELPVPSSASPSLATSPAADPGPPVDEPPAAEPAELQPPVSRAHPADAFSRRHPPVSEPPSSEPAPESRAAHPADAFSRRHPPASEPPSVAPAPSSRGAHPADAFSRRSPAVSASSSSSEGPVPSSRARPADAFSRRPAAPSEPPSDRPAQSSRARPADAFSRRPAAPSEPPSDRPAQSSRAHPADAFGRRPPPASDPPDRAATLRSWTTDRPSRRRHSSAAFSRGDELSGLPSAAVRHFQAAVDAHLKRDYELALWEIEAALEIVPGNRTFELNRSRILETIARRQEREHR